MSVINSDSIRAGASGAVAAFAIDQSCRFNDDDSPILQRTPLTAGNNKTWTWSGWVKRGNIAGSQMSLFNSGAAGGNEVLFHFQTTEALRIFQWSGSYDWQYVTTAFYRDPSAWMHIVLAVDTTQGTASSRVRLYVNGVEVTSFSTDDDPDEDLATDVNNVGDTVFLGTQRGSGHFDGYIADVYFIDGAQLTPSSFSETDDQGNWVPIEYDGTFGNNGFHLDFADSNFFGRNPNSSGTLAVTYVGNTVSTANETAHTFSSHAIGTAGSDRTVIVGATAEGTTMSSVSIGGVAATEVASTTSGSFDASLWALLVTSGTTADIITTCAGSSSNHAVAVWTVTGDATISVADTQSDTTTAAATTSLHIPSGGVAIGLCSNETSGATNTWAGVTENFDAQIETIHNYSGGSTTSSGASVTVSATWTASSVNALCSVSFYPGINLISSGLATNDQMNDSPTDDADNDVGNYCTGNPLAKNVLANCTMTDGNLVGTQTGSDQGMEGTQSFDIANDLVYWEVTQSAATPYNGIKPVGTIHDGNGPPSTRAPNFYGIAGDTGGFSDFSNSFDAYGSGYTTETIGVACGSGAVWISIDGTWQDSATLVEIAAGTTTNAAVSGLTGHFTPYSFNSSANKVITFNFGQTAYDDTKPTGYRSLFTASAPAPAIKDPSKFYQTKLFTGTGAELAITLTDAAGDAFKPDLVWIKDRDTSVNHVITDSARGATKEVNNAAANEVTSSQGLKSFNTSGYTLGTDTDYNASSSPNVAWCWNTEGGAGSSNTAGSINTTTTSVGTTQGLSISTYTGTGNASDTIGHGLGAIPEVVWINHRGVSGTEGPSMYHSAVGNGLGIRPHLTGVPEDNPKYWNDTDPTSTLFTIGTGGEVDASTATYVAWCWTEVAGYSKFGSYEGNGNADGTFVWCGFRPAWILCSSIDSTCSNYIYDHKRDGYNVDNDALLGDSTGAELIADNIDILSNGFKLRIATDPNVAETYWFMAFAEFPFGGDGVAQARAR